MRSTVRRSAAAVFGAAVLSLAATTLAAAEPTFTPDSDDLVGAGSDTSQFVISAAANQYNVNGTRIASYDATGTPNINFAWDCHPGTPPVGTPAGVVDVVPRPNGSSAGVNALFDYPGCFSFARSSSPKSSSNPKHAPMSFVKTLTDGLSYAYAKGTTALDPIRRLSAAQLAAVYTCSNQTYVPVLPQSGSGTRSFFLAQIGVTEAQLGSCVLTAQEHDPAAVAGKAKHIVPFSTARWRSNPTGTAPSATIDIAATQITGSTFFTTRDIFNVVRTTDLPTAKFQAVFGPTGFFCTQYANPNNRQGFDANPSCGTV